MDGATRTSGQRTPDAPGAILVIVLACAFAWAIGLRPGEGWYSSSWAYRLQTEAFFRGTFALQPVPNGQMADWIWANGSHQVWGLGVPFLRFPLEIVARLSGSIGFPDRVTMLLAFAGVATVLSRAFRDLLPWERGCLLLLTAFTPAFVTLCRTRLSVYEEGSAFACMWALLLGGMLLHVARWPSRGALLWTCALAGLAPFFRPTLVFTAAATVAIALVVELRRRRSLVDLAAAAALFGLGIAAVAATNQVRFGSPLETGQLLNVSYIPVDQFSKVFGYPFWYETWTSALRELVSSLVLADGRFNCYDWYQAAIHPWQADSIRFREFYFTTFHPLVLGAVLVSWIAVAASPARRLEDPRMGVAAVWSASVFAMLFVFYMWAPSMTSRYAVDFAAPVAMSLVALFLMLFSSAQRRRSVLVALAGIAWVSHDIARAEISPTHATRALVTEDVVRERLPQPVTEGGLLPAGYRCGENPERFGIKFNGSGWAYLGNCSVDAGTMFFLEDVDCIGVHVTPIDGDYPLGDEAIAPLRAKAGLTELVRTSVETAEPGSRVTFCRPPGAVGSGVEVVYLGWMDPRLVVRGSKPLRLLEIAKAVR